MAGESSKSPKSPNPSSSSSPSSLLSKASKPEGLSSTLAAVIYEISVNPVEGKLRLVAAGGLKDANKLITSLMFETLTDGISTLRAVAGVSCLAGSS